MGWNYCQYDRLKKKSQFFVIKYFFCQVSFDTIYPNKPFLPHDNSPDQACFPCYLHSLLVSLALPLLLCNWIVSCAKILRLFNDSITTGWAQDWPHSITKPRWPELLACLPFISALRPLFSPASISWLFASQRPPLPNAGFVLALNSRLLFFLL